MSLTTHCYHFDNVLFFKPKFYAYNENRACIVVPGDISITGGRLGCHLEYWSYARFAKVANAWFENYRPRRTV